MTGICNRYWMFSVRYKLCFYFYYIYLYWSVYLLSEPWKILVRLFTVRTLENINNVPANTEFLNVTAGFMGLLA